MDNLNTIYKYCLDKYLNSDILYVKELSQKVRLIMAENNCASPLLQWGVSQVGPAAQYRDKAHEKCDGLLVRTDPEGRVIFIIRIPRFSFIDLIHSVHRSNGAV